tara:strand:- start:1013 stop:3802 length:2790 start_codon:yes stop_codon:yes gene_type:complete
VTAVHEASQEASSRQATTALTLATIAFAICFACWVINAILVTYLVQNGVYDFTAQQVGWLIATPILTGAISRVPLGILTDRFGGRSVLTLLMLVVAVPMYLLSIVDSFAGFLLCSLGFGLAGGSFAVGIGYVSCWYKQEKQGTALGIFGMGNAGAAITSLAAPSILTYLALGSEPAEAWRYLPRLYACVLVLMALLFFFGSKPRRFADAHKKSLAERLEPLKHGIVWRFGLYYALVFGSFVAISQWLVPYSVNVYQISLAEAGLLAAIFSLPSGVIRALGGYFADRYGARPLMHMVFVGCAICCALLAIPKMDILSPGVGITAKTAGTVVQVNATSIVVEGTTYPFNAKPQLLYPAIDEKTNSMVLPRLQNWQEPNVTTGDRIERDQLIAKGVTNIYYPANIWVFAVLAFIFGILTGIGKAGVFKYIPEHFPDNVGTVGGIVGLIGALGGFALPMIFGYILSATGVWTTCWIVLAIFSVVCLYWMQTTVNRIMQTEAPDLAMLIESSATRAIPPSSGNDQPISANVEMLLQSLPFFTGLTHEELHSVASIGQFESVARGEIIFEKGDPGDALFVLITGTVSIFLKGEEGSRVELASLTSGGYFGDLALIDGQPRSAGAQATEDCEFFLVKRSQFLRLLTKSPHVLVNVLVGLTEHVRSSNQRYVDVNDKKEKLQNQAELARHQSIAQMVTGVAHEINTPLGIVNHAASIITEELNADTITNVAKDEDAEEVLETIVLAAKLIQDNIARADKLITSFKNLSVRQITDEKEYISLGEVIEDVIRLYSLKAKSAGLSVTFTNEITNADHWNGYPGQLSQVMLNLLSNVDRYAYPNGLGGRVEIRLSCIGTESDKYDFLISVKDYGVGIETAEQAKIFDAFYTTGRSLGGTGIGLSIVYNIVTSQLNGKVELTSDLNHGCEFSVSLPKVVENK